MEYEDRVARFSRIAEALDRTLSEAKFDGGIGGHWLESSESALIFTGSSFLIHHYLDHIAHTHTMHTSGRPGEEFEAARVLVLSQCKTERATKS